jgi:flagellar basal body-associated protein FliL
MYENELLPFSVNFVKPSTTFVVKITGGFYRREKEVLTEVKEKITRLTAAE